MKMKTGGGCASKKTMKGGAKKPMKGGNKKTMKGGDSSVIAPVTTSSTPVMPGAVGMPAMPPMPSSTSMPVTQNAASGPVVIATSQQSAGSMPPQQPVMPNVSTGSGMAPPVISVMPAPTAGPQAGGAKKSKKASGAVMGWCMKCKMMHEMKDPVQFQSNKGRKAVFMKGTCAKTGTKMSAIVGN